MRDEIVEEVQQVRQADAERFNFDIAAIFRDAREQTFKSGRQCVTLAPRRIVPMVEIPILVTPEPVTTPGQPFPFSEES
jgi:hypothetical protein